ncbi:putative RNA-binding protein [Trypanosoma rangeli]|uniref:Putative RNA-binding protein n=1 Tax=Trypanosoma rangeli TaxID=5698 RepID=A0A422NDA8_TRYRA|nr:putative RNA-binding protein [Trypanosoma rangeli]RNF03426.1 putative RNA-binding protein [Trypanosoma rangeli]|eukprot:RNF03426.1 putative RNA-binding protein [Trypanosoma rangeli]
MSYHHNSSENHSNYGGGRGGSGGMRRQRSRSPDAHPQQSHYYHSSNNSNSGYGQPQHYRLHPQQRRSSPPRRPPFRRRREEATYTIPDVAPRLHVPHDLPVDVTAFLDIIAFYVVQGGPTAEEEIMKREENNRHFAFLHASWRDPKQLYYRWRLYSLLQGDTLLRWRTEPYQIERGNEAYVWVPPPAIPSGPECLLDAFKAYPPSSHMSSGGEECQDGGKGVKATSPPQLVPTASWLSRMSVSEGAFFVTLDKAAAAEWQQLLLMEPHVTEVAAAPGLSLEERLKALTAIVLDNERIAQRMVFAVEHQKAALHLLSLLLDEMVQLAYAAAWPQRRPSPRLHDDDCVDRGGGGGDDAALQAAARCCMCLSYLFTLNDIGRNGAAVALTDEEVTSIAPSYQEGGSSATVPHTMAGRSSSNSNNNSGSVSGIAVACGGGGSSTSPSFPVGAEAPHAATPSGVAAPPVRLLNRALEKIMPTLIESTLLVALCTVQQYGSLQVDNARETARSSAKPPGAEEFEGILPLDIDQAAYVHVQAKLSAARSTTTTSSTNTTSGSGTAATAASSPATAPPAYNTAAAVAHVKKEDRDAVCMIAMLLVSWLKQLCSTWADADIIGSRCWSTLLTKYIYLLSQPIETT